MASLMSIFFWGGENEWYKFYDNIFYLLCSPVVNVVSVANSKECWTTYAWLQAGLPMPKCGACEGEGRFKKYCTKKTKGTVWCLFHPVSYLSIYLYICMSIYLYVYGGLVYLFTYLFLWFVYIFIIYLLFTHTGSKKKRPTSAAF